MKKLLLDSSDSDLSVGIAEDDCMLYRFSSYAWQRQSEYMIPEIEKALKRCGMELRHIDRVVLGIGPGSYTGVRIPLTIAKTLNAALQTEIVALSSLKIMGRADERYIALMNARSGRSYIGIYEKGAAIVADRIIANDELKEFLKPYLENDFVLRGHLSYLDAESDGSPDVLEGLLSYSAMSQPCASPMSLCPVYLKENP